MKVICIDISPYPETGNPDHLKLLKEGNIYTVIGFSDPIKDAYVLHEVNHPTGGGWYTKRFIPLSTIDETELLEQRENQLITT